MPDEFKGPVFRKYLMGIYMYTDLGEQMKENALNSKK